MEWISQNYKEILDSITDAVIFIDKDFNIVFANRAMFDLCNTSGEDLIGRKCYEMAHGCSSPCPENCLSDIICPHSEIFRGGEPVTVTHTHSMPDGSEKIFEITASPLRDGNGDIFRVVEVLRDITSKKHAEYFLQEILESMGEGLVVIDRDYRIISANKAYCQQMGRSNEEVIGKFCYEISHRNLKPCNECGEDCAAGHTFSTGRPYTVVHTHYEKKGRPHYVELKSYPMLDSHGEVSSVIEIMSDITEKKTLEDQLRQAQKMEAIGTLTGGIAHDFNNILTAVMGYAHLMQMKMAATDPLRPYAEQILSASEKSSNMVQGLLAFSRKQTVNPQLHSINEIIQNSEKLLARLINEEVGFSISLRAVDALIMADSGQIVQMLMNLVTNARDAMPNGGRITISTENVDLDSDFMRMHGYENPGRYILLTVEDTGTGIDEAIMDKIFEPFFTTKEQGKGTGLGLAMSYGIIKQHKGYVNVTSLPGKGTAFRIYLPSAGSAAARPEKGGKAAPDNYHGTETVLVADDNDEVRRIVSYALRESGYNTIDTVDGIDALNRYMENRESIRLLVLDIMMPRKNGKEVYEEIRRMDPAIRTILMSGYNSVLTDRSFISEQGVAYLSKPFSPVELLKTARALLDS